MIFPYGVTLHIRNLSNGEAGAGLYGYDISKTISIFSYNNKRPITIYVLSIIPMTRTEDQMAKASRPRSNHEFPQKSMLIMILTSWPVSLIDPFHASFSLLAANSFSFCARPTLLPPPFIFAFNPLPSLASQITCRLHNMIRPAS